MLYKRMELITVVFSNGSWEYEPVRVHATDDKEMEQDKGVLMLRYVSNV
jgi:hypothetical protein